MTELQQARKDPKFLASATLIALILGAGIVLIGIHAFGGGDDKQAAPSGSSSNAPDTGQTSSACGLPDGGQSVPAEAPQTAWDLNGTMAAPTSKRYGPRKTSHGVHSCFSRSPFGALFAASNFYSDALGTNSVTTAFVERWFIDGPAKNRALAAVSAPSTREPVPQQIVAFRVDSYSRSRTTVTLVTQETGGPNAGGLRSFPTTVVWTTGDWKVDADNTASGAPTRIQSLAGYTKWSGIS